MSYDQGMDTYTCHNGKTLKPKGVVHRKSATGYLFEITVYECESYEGYPCKEKCTKAKGNRQMQVSKFFSIKQQ